MQKKVSIVNCHDYRYEDVYSAVKHSIDLLGGIGKYVKTGQSVLLKPNLLSGKHQDMAITTHPAIVKAVITLVREAGGRPFIGDSPAAFPFAKEGIDKIAEIAGIKDMADEMCVDIIDLNEPMTVSGPVGGTFKEYEISRVAINSDLVINLPKLKTHSQMVLTSAVKNLFGCVPGTRKVQWHYKAGVDRIYFARMLVEVSQIINPVLTIVDGIIGLEGDGPGSAGTPRHIGLIVAGTNCSAIDLVVSKIVGVPEDQIPTIIAAREKGIVKDLDEVMILGEQISKVAIRDFKLPASTDLVFGPKVMRGIIKESVMVKPIEDRDTCTLCGECAQICPTSVITVGEKRLEIDYRRCIS
ncbi:MAG: DUF362 domain-containing protein, partial [Nitrospirota bacterium]